MAQILQNPIILWLLVALIFYVGIKIAFFLGEQKSQRDALRRQRPVLAGKLSEQLAPYLKGFPEDLKPSEARFMGAPVDFIVFKGMDEQNIDEVVFVEVKSGKAQLSTREKSLRDAIQTKRVRWYEYRIGQDMIDGSR